MQILNMELIADPLHYYQDAEHPTFWEGFLLSSGDGNDLRTTHWLCCCTTRRARESQGRFEHIGRPFFNRLVKGFELMLLSSSESRTSVVCVPILDCLYRQCYRHPNGGLLEQVQ